MLNGSVGAERCDICQDAPPERAIRRMGSRWMHAREKDGDVRMRARGEECSPRGRPCVIASLDKEEATANSSCVRRSTAQQRTVRSNTTSRRCSSQSPSRNARDLAARPTQFSSCLINFARYFGPVAPPLACQRSPSAPGVPHRMPETSRPAMAPSQHSASPQTPPPRHAHLPWRPHSFGAVREPPLRSQRTREPGCPVGARAR